MLLRRHVPVAPAAAARRRQPPQVVHQGAAALSADRRVPQRLHRRQQYAHAKIFSGGGRKYWDMDVFVPFHELPPRRRRGWDIKMIKADLLESLDEVVHRHSRPLSCTCMVSLCMRFTQCTSSSLTCVVVYFRAAHQEAAAASVEPAGPHASRSQSR